MSDERYETKHVQVKASNQMFGHKSFIHFTGSPLYESFLGIMCHSLLYFVILTNIN